MKKTNPRNYFLPLLRVLNLAIISESGAADSAGRENSRSSSFKSSFVIFKDAVKGRIKKIFKKKSLQPVASPSISPTSVITMNPSIEITDFGSPTSSLPPQQVTVSELFGEISISHDDFEGWKPTGLGLGQIAGWARSQHRQEKLIEIARADYEINLTRVNENPIVLNEENASFFENKDLDKNNTDLDKRDIKDLPYDGTWAGFKYIFYPHTVVDSDEISDDDQPISFYLMKKISSHPQDMNFSKGKESLHLGEDLYHSAIVERSKGNIPAAIVWFEKAAAEGNSRANLLLSQFYLDGNGVEKDEEQGMKYLSLAAVEGNSEAQYQMALLNYFTFPSTEESLATAIEWLLKANAQGHLRARFYLAGLYADGKGLVENTELAKELFSQVAKASKDGSVLELRAQIRFDDLNEDYGSQLRNQVELQSLANGGMPNAMAALSVLTFDGQANLPGPVIINFLKRAAAAGNHEAIIMLKRTGIEQ
ncbi:MAG: tetratricopeptide repeat protein [Bdellovibrionia bacterium]